MSDRKPTIDELEAILKREEDVPVEILPNGEITTKVAVQQKNLGTKKPLTMREDLGGEYAGGSAWT